MPYPSPRLRHNLVTFLEVLRGKMRAYLLCPVASRFRQAAMPNCLAPVSRHLLTMSLYLGSKTNRGQATQGKAVVQTKTGTRSLLVIVVVLQASSCCTSSCRWAAARAAYSFGASHLRALSTSSVTVF